MALRVLLAAVVGATVACSSAGPSGNPGSGMDAGAAAPEGGGGPPPDAGVDAASSGDAGSGVGDGGVEASAPCTVTLGPNEECRDGLPAPVFQQLPAGFAMDTTEITRSQYAAWLATKPPTSGQVTACGANSTFEPDPSCLAAQGVCATSCDEHPQVCVDWCDAAAYCAALGKQLCGARPDAVQQGMTVGFTEFANPELDQYEYACSADGKQQYVYADTYDAKACNTGCTGTTCTTIPVATKVTCQGEPQSSAFPGIFDLDGNVAEWDGVCASADPTAPCHVRGGDMRATGTTSACSYGSGAAVVPRNQPGPTVGFRCCSAM